MECAFTRAELATASTRQTYGYDYAGRRVWQATEEYVSGAWDTASPTELKRYIYDGRKIVMVLDGNNDNAELASYTWGLDLSGQAGHGLWGVGGVRMRLGVIPRASFQPLSADRIRAMG